MRKLTKFLIIFIMLLIACSYQQPVISPLSEPFPTPNTAIPNFKHIAIIIFENKEFDHVIENPNAQYINKLAWDNTLLTQYYAVAHPSLPNYLALIGGDTYGYTTDCKFCPVNAVNLADLIERSGRTWMTYQESMPSDCATYDQNHRYVKKHNPFVYFTSIVDDKQRCNDHVEELHELSKDAANNRIPNFLFITPNICNSGHDCTIKDSDEWLANTLPALIESFQKESDDYLIIITWDEGQTNKTCCGLPAEAGGHVATLLISPHVKQGFWDDTPYTTYSLLRTISEGWGLPLLAHASEENNKLILAPWK